MSPCRKARNIHGILPRLALVENLGECNAASCQETSTLKCRKLRSCVLFCVRTKLTVSRAVLLLTCVDLVLVVLLHRDTVCGCLMRPSHRATAAVGRRTAKKTPHFTVTKINRLTLFKEIIAVYGENRTKDVNTKWRVTDCWSRRYV
jgi:hypothetical protein